MTRQADTQTQTRNHGDHDALAYEDPALANDCQVCGAPMPGTEVARYPFDRPDAARRHAVAIGGRRVLDDETGHWVIYGDVDAEADRALRETPDRDLVRYYARLTHGVHATRETVNRARRTGKPRTLATAKEALDDVRATRDCIEAEILRRMGGE